MAKVFYRTPKAVAIRPQARSIFVTFSDLTLVVYYGGTDKRSYASGVYYPGGPPVAFDSNDIPNWKYTDAQQEFIDDCMGATRKRDPEKENQNEEAAKASNPDADSPGGRESGLSPMAAVQPGKHKAGGNVRRARVAPDRQRVLV